MEPANETHAIDRFSVPKFPVRCFPLILSLMIAALPIRSRAACPGDCDGDARVVVSEVVRLVSIALEQLPESSCPAGDVNGDQMITVEEIVGAVNSIFEGCPPLLPSPTTSTTATPSPTPTPTATTAPSATASAPFSPTPTLALTQTATSTPTATQFLNSTPSPSSTVTGTAGASVTANPSPSAIATATRSPSTAATSTNTATSSPTMTPSPPPSATGTPTSTPSPTATATTAATLTRTGTPTATRTATPTATATTTATHTQTGTATATPTATLTTTATLTRTATSTATRTVSPTATQFPVGGFVGGKVGIVAAGLGSAQSVAAAILTALTNSAPAPLLSRGAKTPVLHGCAVSGTTSQDCTTMGTGVDKTIHLVLGANHCVTGGLWGGTAAFNGSITIDSSPFFTNSCGPPPTFTSATYTVEGPPEDPGQGFETVLRDSQMNDKEFIGGAQLKGMLFVSPAAGTACLINGITLTLDGFMLTQFAEGSEVTTIFNDATMVMDQIIFNAYCVPIYYRLKFTGGVQLGATFPGDIQTGFSATFANFFLTQDATGGRTLSDLSGELSTDCFGSASLEPGTSLSVAPGTLCPLTGQFSANGSGGATAMLTYEDGQLIIEQAGGRQVYPDCRAEELQMCLPQ